MTLTLGGAALAAGGLADGEQRAFRFEVRALGATIGDAVLSIGALQDIGGHKLRPVSVQAKTRGLGATLYPCDTTSTSWVDAATMPVLARWDATIPGGKRVVKARFDGNHVKGEDHRNGKLKKRLDRKLGARAADIISSLAWLLEMDLTAGTQVRAPLYDGLRIYLLSATVGDVQEIRVPGGLRQAVPIRVAVTRGDKFRKDIVYWVDPVTRTPYKLSFKFGVLGSVDALLIAERKA
jgi:hypothetical protein